MSQDQSYQLQWGLGIGFAIEANTDKVAEKKIIIAEACKQAYPLESKITEEFHTCITEGVPGGTNIGGDKLKVDQPAAFVDAYVTAHEKEIGIELNRLALWGVAGAAIGAADFIL